jgi:hypothetical protein
MPVMAGDQLKGRCGLRVGTRWLGALMITGMIVMN